jgi:ectoine hydroxylase-related dioxygenase (phytanoyl-CoA dioxygenase family)
VRTVALAQRSDEEKSKKKWPVNSFPIHLENSRINIQRKFLEDGFLVCRNFFAQKEMDELLWEIKKTAQLLRESGDNGVGKMFFYHNLYKTSSYIQKFSSQPKIVEILCQLIGPSVWMHWDHAVEKESGGGSFPWHQDNAYSELKDGGVQLWIAVSDSKEQHGGLVFQRGSHKKGLLPYRKVGNHRVCDEKVGEEVVFSCSAGDAVFFSSYTLHHSKPNVSDDDRWVYILEYMSQKHVNPSIRRPYFMIADKGRSDPKFVQTFWGRQNPINRLKYYRYLKIGERIRSSMNRVK